MPKTNSRKRYHKHKKSSRGFLKKLRTTTSKAIPVVASGLKKVGTSVKNITVKSKPTVEKGLSTIYKTVLSGFDLGVKGLKKGINVIKNKTRRNKSHRKH
uniref:Uncharacterized protein n=1 Tax=viral metagenome TaxID=1070528 RepID=A0A6C0JFF9_9ZZZZ